MLQKISRNLLIGAFLLAIFTPVAVMLSSERAEISVHEKRRLASPPAWHWDSRILNEFPSQFTAFFNDHYGLREKLVERSQHLKKKYLNKSPTWMVIRGEDDWLFADRRDSLRDHIGLDRLDIGALAGIQQQLIDKQAWLATKGIEYFFVPVPNKMTLYAQYLPERIRDYSGVTVLDQVLAYLQEQAQFYRYTNLEPVLADYQDSHPDTALYYRTDSHWNSLGAFVAYRHIMHRLMQFLPRLEPPLSLEQMELHQVRHDGDLSNIINVGGQARETSQDLVPRQRCARETDQPLYTVDQAEFEKQNHKMVPETNGCEQRSLSAVIVHDSFGAHLKPFFSESFSRVVFINNRAEEKLESILESEKPDLLLEILIERNLRSRMLQLPPGGDQ